MSKPIRATVVILVAGVAVIAPLVRTQKAEQADLRQRKIGFESEPNRHREIFENWHFG